jgi:hypothetical protein
VVLATWAGVVDNGCGWDLPGTVVNWAGGAGDVDGREL